MISVLLVNTWELMVVYHFHGQTSQFMVWLNGSQSSGLVNFVPSIAFTISTIRTNQFHLPKNGREGLKLVSRMASKKWNTNFHLEYSIWKNRTTFSDVPLISEIFRRKTPKKSFSIYFPTGFPGKLLGKHPMRTERSPHVRESVLRNPGKFCLWNPES